MEEERRQNRSDDIETALKYQLMACCQRAGLQHMVIGDEDGYLVAAENGKNFESEELAAYLPIACRPEGGYIPEDLKVRPFTAVGSQLYLGAQGNIDANAEAEMCLAICGAMRILN